MKKYLSLLLILMLSVTLFSCKKKADENEPYIESVAGESGENDNSTEKADTQTENEDTAQKSEPITETPDKKPEPEPKPEQKPLEENKEESDNEQTQQPEQEHVEMEYMAEFPDLPAVPSIDLVSIPTQKDRIYGYILPRYFYDFDAPIIVDYNGSRYYHHEQGDSFPKYTVYEDFDLSKLTPTDEQVEIKRGTSGPLDNSYLEVFETGLLCKLPDNMKNDPYIDMIAVKRADGKTVLFSTTAVANRNTPSTNKPIYDVFLKNNRVCASECLKAEDVDAVLLSHCQYGDFKIKKQVTLSREQAQELYSKVIEFERSDEKASKEHNEGILLSFRFKDGTSHLYIEYRPDIESFLGCKSIKGFNDYIFSLLDKPGIQPEDPLMLIKSDGNLIKSYENNIWSESWSGKGWISGDGPGLSYKFNEVSDQIPQITYSDDFEIYFNGNVALGSSAILNNTFDMHRDCVDKQTLDTLTAGTYYLKFNVQKRDEYVEAAQRHERSGYECVYKIIITD